MPQALVMSIHLFQIYSVFKKQVDNFLHELCQLKKKKIDFLTKDLFK